MAQPGSSDSGRDLGVRLAQRQMLDRIAALAAQAPWRPSPAAASASWPGPSPRPPTLT